MDDRAVSPVVAAMLLLAVLVMFLSVYNAVVIPSLKQQAEVEHLRAVEESFLAFGSDITTAAALKQDLHLSKRIPLGGGETILDPVRSAGTLRVDPGGPLANVTLNGTTYTCNLTKFSYTPIGNFWRNQGYAWQYGYTNVTDEVLQTPLDYPGMDEVCEAASASGFARSLIGIEHEGSENCTKITISLVTFELGERNFTSGNGVGTLFLDATVEDIPVNLTDTGASKTIEIAVNTSLPVPLNASLWQKCNETLSKMNGTYDNVEDYMTMPEEGRDRVTLSFDEEHVPEVTLRLVRVVVSARG
ncbi:MULTISPECIES: hypothetical protein [unclassified Methanoculleus]|uniref:hypothetical protein n=1 Tax=unclassified Methanoculleus TaxID=2619537 RepID=UPI0025D92438|nr:MULTISPECIES: hypothetical protein [unclassified Methanoculleus]